MCHFNKVCLLLASIILLNNVEQLYLLFICNFKGNGRALTFYVNNVCLLLASIILLNNVEQLYLLFICNFNGNGRALTFYVNYGDIDQ